MTSTSSSLQTPIFTGKNYEYWSLTMKHLFKGQDVWEIVHHGYAKPVDNCLEGKKEERWKKFVLHTSSHA